MGKDKSGNDENATQSTASDKPTYDGSTKITFDRTNDFLSTSASLKSAFFVVRNANGSGASAGVCPLIGTTDTTSSVFLRSVTADYSISVDGSGSSNTGDASINSATLTPGTGLGTNISISGFVPFPNRDQADIVYFQLDSTVTWDRIASFKFCVLIACRIFP